MKIRIIRDFLAGLAEALRPETRAAREIREREELKAWLRAIRPATDETQEV